ncbi:HEAT repeat domain-containing protein [Streptomyces sp. NPDC020965]|uniref:HEAT repeat domain-containing protein n=1 Tax=Streptomyces sp. NPDC020965 TaxID=3365105 RepID=UPI0037B287E1
MDLEQAFADLDSVRWADLEHAYGEAGDLPGILRALAGDEPAAAEAFDELWGSILHQGTVYSATVAAVPFLARAATAGVRTVELLLLLGGMAQSEDEYGIAEPGACRAAVVAELPLILPMMDSADGAVRQAAAWAAGRSGAAAALPFLRRRWAREGEPSVRAELLAALAHLDAAGSAPTVLASISPGEPAELRVEALLAGVDIGLPWSPAHRDTLLSLLPADPYLADRFDQERTEPLRYVVDALLRRDTDADRAFAYELIEAGLRLRDPEAREEALWAAEHACVLSRSAPARLASALLALLAEPSFPHTASLLPILDLLGTHAAPAAPAIARLATDGGELADRALEVLVRVAPEQAAPLLARDLGHRTRALAAAVGGPGARPARPIPYAPELLNAIRIRLSGTGADELTGPEPSQLTGLLTGWGGLAAAALPELTAALDRFPTLVPAALTAVCPDESREATAALLRRAAGPAVAPDPSEPPSDTDADAYTAAAECRYAAAEALHGLTGETGPLVDAVAEALLGDVSAGVPRTAGELGPAGVVLVPRLRAALTAPGGRRTVPEMNTDIQIAVALWRLTGDAEEPVRVLRGVLAEAADGMWTSWPLRNVARAAARLGPVASPLAPGLRALLDDPDQVPTAIPALHSMECAIDRSLAVDLLLTSAERSADPEAALASLAALGSEALTPETRSRLTALAERDLRLAIPGVDRETVAADERLRGMAREILRG